MADKVQLTLENMLPELDVLNQAGIFSKKEIKKIVKKRRHYEYQFEKKDVAKFEFFKAIKYEKILDKRRKKKKKELNINKMNHYDFQFLRRIVYIFEKCARKFKNDELVWVEFFNFLVKSKSHKILNKEIGSCIVNHPHKIDFWKIAAYNEFENNFNALAARNIFQKCLRLNKDNLNAYLAYFEFELKFVEKIIERRNLLQGKEEEKNKLKFINDTTEENAVEEEVAQDEGDDVSRLKIPEIIWHRALSNVKFNEILEIDTRFLASLMMTGKKTHYKPLKERMINHARENSRDSESEAKIVNALLNKYDEKSFYKKAIHKYSKLIKSHPDETNFLVNNLRKVFAERSTNIAEEEKEKVNCFFFETIASKLDLKDLVSNFDKTHNYDLIKTFFDHVIFSSIKIEFNIEEVLEKIIESTLQTRLQNYQILSEIYEIYWKFLIYKHNKDVHFVFDKFSSLITKNSEVNKVILTNLCKVVKEDIKVDPTKAVYYLDLLIGILKEKRSISYDTKKAVLCSMLTILYQEITYGVNKEDLLFNKHKYFKSLDKNLTEALSHLKEEMEKILINYPELKKNYLRKFCSKLSSNEMSVLHDL